MKESDRNRAPTATAFAFSVNLEAKSSLDNVSTWKFKRWALKKKVYKRYMGHRSFLFASKIYLFAHIAL